ncbi:hypothetical protein OF122_08340 [Pelagibacterium flavum]|uniref:Porin n=1 Tax=Pelagibacterium flavum TaxID=2984530 RepID=A0ABY6IWJ7_9HYPH|nr:hypothetical protein [Pelagibacterium sp. YIM 151497]MAN78068.1 hypothetical protein [Hyphomicrobiales bacterium]UYQ73752.1 hypothetical protein OF122_08340 [Pelagibacterium sp. YIM 151497]
MLTLSADMGPKAFLTTTTIALAAALATGASAMDISVGSNVRLSAGYLSLNHDASHLTPPGGPGMASYGDPTSILSYEPLYQADIEFVVSGRGGEGWFDLIAGFPIAAGGTFGDRDYEVGQALYSETFSDLALGNGGDVSLRYGLPTDGTLIWNDMVVRPYVTGGFGLQRYDVNGLRCGAACPSGPIASSVTVIGHDMFSASAGLGVWLENEISEAETIDLRFEINGGYLGVTDSHYLRVWKPAPASGYDLGPVPNVFYNLATVGGLAEAAYRYETEQGASLSASVFAGGQLGLGGVTFGSAGGPQTGPLWAWSVAGHAGVSLGASVPF